MFKIIKFRNYELTLNTRYGSPYICLHHHVINETPFGYAHMQRLVFGFGGIFGKGF